MSETVPICDECGHDAWAHTQQVDHAGDLIAPIYGPCLLCGCLAPREITDYILSWH